MTYRQRATRATSTAASTSEEALPGVDRSGRDVAVTGGPADHGARSSPSPWRRVLRISAGMTLMIGVLVTAFAWPATETGPRDVPIAVVGASPAVAQVEQQLEASMPGAFEVRPAADVPRARELMTGRDVYGAIVLQPSQPPLVLTASAASPAVAQLLNGVAAGLARGAGDATAAGVEDVVPLPPGDPRGVGLATAALPMVLGGMIVGIGMSFLVAGVRRRVGGAIATAMAAGLVTTTVIQPWLGSLDGTYLLNAGVVALTIAAISTAVIGLYALIGTPGIGLNVVVIFLVGNQISGLSSAPEMLPEGWGTVGQLLPPGASGTLLRSVAFFDGAGAAGPALVLTAWLVAGWSLAALGARLRPGSHAARA